MLNFITSVFTLIFLFIIYTLIYIVVYIGFVYQLLLFPFRKKDNREKVINIAIDFLDTFEEFTDKYKKNND